MGPATTITTTTTTTMTSSMQPVCPPGDIPLYQQHQYENNSPSSVISPFNISQTLDDSPLIDSQESHVIDGQYSPVNDSPNSPLIDSQDSYLIDSQEPRVIDGQDSPVNDTHDSPLIVSHDSPLIDSSPMEEGAMESCMVDLHIERPSDDSDEEQMADDYASSTSADTTSSTTSSSPSMSDCDNVQQATEEPHHAIDGVHDSHVIAAILKRRHPPQHGDLDIDDDDLDIDDDLVDFGLRPGAQVLRSSSLTNRPEDILSFGDLVGCDYADPPSTDRTQSASVDSERDFEASYGDEQRRELEEEMTVEIAPSPLPPPTPQQTDETGSFDTEYAEQVVSDDGEARDDASFAASEDNTTADQTNQPRDYFVPSEPSEEPLVDELADPEEEGQLIDFEDDATTMVSPVEQQVCATTEVTPTTTDTTATTTTTTSSSRCTSTSSSSEEPSFQAASYLLDSGEIVESPPSRVDCLATAQDADDVFSLERGSLQQGEHVEDGEENQFASNSELPVDEREDLVDLQRDEDVLEQQAEEEKQGENPLIDNLSPISLDSDFVMIRESISSDDFEKIGGSEEGSFVDEEGSSGDEACSSSYDSSSEDDCAIDDPDVCSEDIVAETPCAQVEYPTYPQSSSSETEIQPSSDEDDSNLPSCSTSSAKPLQSTASGKAALQPSEMASLFSVDVDQSSDGGDFELRVDPAAPTRPKSPLPPPAAPQPLSNSPEPSYDQGTSQIDTSKEYCEEGEEEPSYKVKEEINDQPSEQQGEEAVRAVASEFVDSILNEIRSNFQQQDQVEEQPQQQVDDEPVPCITVTEHLHEKIAQGDYPLTYASSGSRRHSLDMANSDIEVDCGMDYAVSEEKRFDSLDDVSCQQHQHIGEGIDNRSYDSLDDEREEELMQIVQRDDPMPIADDRDSLDNLYGVEKEEEGEEEEEEEYEEELVQVYDERDQTDNFHYKLDDEGDLEEENNVLEQFSRASEQPEHSLSSPSYQPTSDIINDQPREPFHDGNLQGSQDSSDYDMHSGIPDQTLVSDIDHASVCAAFDQMLSTDPMPNQTIPSDQMLHDDPSYPATSAPTTSQAEQGCFALPEQLDTDPSSAYNCSEYPFLIKGIQHRPPDDAGDEGESRDDSLACSAGRTIGQGVDEGGDEDEAGGGGLFAGYAVSELTTIDEEAASLCSGHGAISESSDSLERVSLLRGYGGGGNGARGKRAAVQNHGDDVSVSSSLLEFENLECQVDDGKTSFSDEEENGEVVQDLEEDFTGEIVADLEGDQLRDCDVVVVETRPLCHDLVDVDQNSDLATNDQDPSLQQDHYREQPLFDPPSDLPSDDYDPLDLYRLPSNIDPTEPSDNHHHHNHHQQQQQQHSGGGGDGDVDTSLIRSMTSSEYSSSGISSADTVVSCGHDTRADDLASDESSAEGDQPSHRVYDEHYLADYADDSDSSDERSEGCVASAATTNSMLDSGEIADDNRRQLLQEGDVDYSHSRPEQVAMTRDDQHHGHHHRDQPKCTESPTTAAHQHSPSCYCNLLSSSAHQSADCQSSHATSGGNFSVLCSARHA